MRTRSISRATSPTTQVTHRPYPPLLPLADPARTYTGRTAIDRLIHILTIAPAIAAEAYQLCVQHIHQSRDPALFQNLLQAYEQLAPPEGVALPNALDLAQLDVAWADEAMQRNQADRVKLEVELKTYSNNMIKESIRVSVGLWVWNCGC